MTAYVQIFYTPQQYKAMFQSSGCNFANFFSVIKVDQLWNNRLPVLNHFDTVTDR